MTIEIDEIVKARMGDALEKELKNNAHFLQKQEEWSSGVGVLMALRECLRYSHSIVTDKILFN